MSSNKLTRLDFLKTSLLTTTGAAIGLNGCITDKSDKKKRYDGDAKNVIFLVSDGMSSGTLALADLVKRRQFGKRSHWLSLYDSDRKHHRGLMDMASLNSVVTGSAAAASSWGSGHRVENTTLNWSPSGEQFKTICQIFKEAGKATGLVTTTRITHATPSGFSINMPKRGMEDEIASQHLERDVDILLGGGRKHFKPETRNDKIDLLSKFSEKGYKVATSKQEIESLQSSDNMIGLFYESHLPYTLDWNNDDQLKKQVPSLAEMTRTALNNLDKRKNGFLLQVEGGRVDHAAHGNDAAAMVYDQIAFDEVVGIVLEFTANRDDTLVILTTDHGNANPGLAAHGSKYNDSNQMIDSLFNYKHSFEWMFEKINYEYDKDFKGKITIGRIRDLITEATNTTITKEEAAMVKMALDGNFRAPYKKRSSTEAVLSGVLANYNGIYFISTGHTSDYVEIAAWGPGSERIPGFVKNTDLFHLMVDMAGVRKYAE